MFLPSTVGLWLVLVSSLHGADTLPDGFYRYPTIGGGVIVFTAEGDLWKVPVSGGVAMRLTAHEGEECFAKISPDGRLIAFTAQYEGNDDVYVMTISGGEPVRLTWHPAAWVSFEPDGKRVAVQKIGLEFHNWKRYKGGEAEKIYVGDLNSLAFNEVTHYDGKNAFPMWLIFL